MLERARAAWSRVNALLAGLRLMRDPNRLPDVFVLDRGLPRDVIDRIVDAARAHPDGRAALERKPRLALDLERLRPLEPGSFGRAVADFYDANGLTPSAIPTLEALDDASFVQAHLYETHDIWHVATGFGSSVAEELGLQAVYAAQIPGRLAPLLIAGGLLQAALFVHDDFAARLAAVVRGYSLGKRSVPLFGVPWDDMWELSTDEVRRRLNLAGVEGSLRLELAAA